MTSVRRTVTGGVIWGLVAGACCFVALPHVVSAERRDPLPSPLYQHSLKTSIDKFDGPVGSIAGGKVSRERVDAAQTAGGGTQRVADAQTTVDDCWLAQAVFVLSFNPSPAGCDDGEAITFNTDPSTPHIVRRPAPPYLPAPFPPDIPIELIALSLRGVSSEGPVSVDLNTSQPAPGMVRDVTTDAGGNFQSANLCSILPYLQITKPDGAIVSTQVPIEIVALNLTSLPPIGHQFSTPPSQPPVQLFDINNAPAGWICAIPVYIPVESVDCPPSTTPTMEGAPSCHGASTCPGFYTCMNATCAAIQTCQSVTCTAEPTCAGSEATCSPNPTCAYYPSCIGTATCQLQGTCIGSQTCRGTGTCPGAPTCDPPPTYQVAPGCEQPTLPGGPSCHGSSTCPGSYTCLDASCAAFQTCSNPTCTSEPTCTPRSSTCSYTPTCPLYPSCQGTVTCGEAPSCVGSSTCQGATTCEGTSTCEPPAPTLGAYVSCPGYPTCPEQPTCYPGISCAGGYTCPPYPTCDGLTSCGSAPTCPAQITCNHSPTCDYSCEGDHSCEWPTSHGMYTCGDGACPTSIAQASCPGQWLCPTYSGYYTCPSASCITMDGSVSCSNGPACITWSNFNSCNSVICDDVPPPPTFPGFQSCRAANCLTWLGSPSCPGDFNCPPPQPTIQGASCAILCVPATMQGNPTCMGVASCAPNPTCRRFGTCAGGPTCAPAGTCGAVSCPNFNTCAGFISCVGSVTCNSGHTCPGNITCANATTCSPDALTCSGSNTCNVAPTCGPSATCNNPSCQSLTCQSLSTCPGSETCASQATCDGNPTCNGAPTCNLSFTCGGYPTCQEPPYDIPCELKLCLDSLREGWIRLHIPPDSTQAFEWSDWHGGPIHPMLIWDEVSPKIPGQFVITEWFAPPPQAGIVDTEYVRFPYWVDSIHVQDSDGDVHVSVGDFLLLKFATPAPIYGQTAWFEVYEIGKSRPQDKKFILKLRCARPLAVACACNCHADPICDGIINNVQDVVAVVGVAFRGAPAITDPSATCPYQTTDVNCDGVTSVIDVVKFVNVAFRGGIPAVEYCDPCP